MLPWLSAVIVAAALLLALTALVYLLVRRGVDDRLLLIAGILEVALLGQLVVGLVQAIPRQGEFEKAVFLASLVTLPFVPPVATFLALKEKTRSSMAVVAGAAVVVGVFIARLTQMWNAGG